MREYANLAMRFQGYKSLVPLQHLCWQLARNIRFSNQKIYVIIKQMLIRSLAYCKMVADMVTAAGKSIKVHPRQKGEVSHYCSTCEVRSFISFSHLYLTIYIEVDAMHNRGADFEERRALQNSCFFLKFGIYK